ncbi:cupin domain-containing protein [Flavobacterium soli]|uniref:cupin domain-containing protein n=1 Tax=Flavobacterium soli TaxID=344881 RepID=UPI00040E8C62|nr:cupin domain-containing protein [Flavobacterium soli]
MEKKTIILEQGEGRSYNMGAMQAIFLADEQETDAQYSVSQWWLDPNSEGPGAHLHEDNDEVFYVLEGTMSFLAGEKWVDAKKGTFLRIPSKTLHDFANRTSERAGVLNFYIPGGFERNMPSIVKWFEEQEG